MTNLQADVAAVKELVKLARNGGPWQIGSILLVHDVNILRDLQGSIPAIERLLGIVSAVEKLEAEWRDGLPGMSDGAREIYTAYRKGCADELKALLDREK